MYESIYKEGTILEEPVVFVESNGTICANLAVEPTEIMKIYNPIRGESIELKDISVKGKTLSVKSGNVPFLKEGWLRAIDLPAHIQNLGTEYNITDVLLMDAKQLASFQYRVTYAVQQLELPRSAYYASALARFREKARNGNPLTILLYGDSISNAANSSGEGLFEPFEKPWCEQAIERIRSEFHNRNIELVNRSRSGYGSAWGAEYAAENIRSVDLLVVAFGMNDATENLPCEKFTENIRRILEERKNSDCDVVLVSSILPNPNSEYARLALRKSYGEALKKLCFQNGFAFMDMLSVSEYYETRKRYCEISGNNFNHPNDFIYRLYADAFTYLLTQEA